jgi:transposase
MDIFFVLGVVVSKNKLDYCLMSNDKVLKQGTTVNETSAIRLTLTSFLREFKLSNDQILICAEHSGQYNYPLIYCCECDRYKLWLENPNQIKIYCSGLQQGKNYRLSPKQIAVYCFRNEDKIKLRRQPVSEVEHLKQLHNELEMLEVDSAKLHSQLIDQKNYMSEEVFNINATRLINLLRGLEDAIATIKSEIKCIFADNSFLSEQLELLTSIENVGTELALKMIVETDAFTRFENCRQFCSHAGIAPLNKVLKINEHSTHTINPKSDKGIKTILNQAALSIVKKNDSELKNYYIRKLKEGKDEKIVLNAIRVKLVARMFAVIKNNQRYLPVFRKEESFTTLKEIL